jgi:hypothetical protein
MDSTKRVENKRLSPKKRIADETKAISLLIVLLKRQAKVYYLKLVWWF